MGTNNHDLIVRSGISVNINELIMRIIRLIKYVSIIMIFFLHSLYSQSLTAQENFDFGEINNGGRINLPVSGRLSFEGGRQIGNPDRWIQLGPALNLVIDYTGRAGQFYFEGIERYNGSYRIEKDPKETRNEYEIEFIFRELYWKRAFGSVTVSAGKMIDDSGVMDMLMVIDKVSSLNRTDYFFADPEEFKLGQNLLRLEYFGEEIYGGLSIIPYPSYDRITDLDHPYALIAGRELYKSSNEREPEGRLLITKYFSKGQVSVYSGCFNNRIPLIRGSISEGSGILDIYKLYKPFWSAGCAVNIAVEPFLLKFETAFNFNRPLQTSSFKSLTGYLREHQAEASFGIDYNRGKGGMYVFEIGATIPMEKQEPLAVGRNTYFGLVSWSNSYYNDKLRISHVTIFPESVRNIINRNQLDYYVRDTFSIALKYTSFSIDKYKENYGFMNDYDRFDFAFNFDFKF